MMEPAAVYLWPNEMVMVFDAEGRQIAELQGRLADVREKLAAAITPATQFPAGRWKEIESQPISRETLRMPEGGE
jgi:hypothetical protein